MIDTIEEVYLEDRYVYALREEILIGEQEMLIKKFYDGLHKYEVIGKPFSYCEGVGKKKNSWILYYGIEVSAKNKDMENVEFHLGGDFLKKSYVGPYESPNYTKGFQDLLKYLKSKKYKVNGFPIEMYIVGPKDEKDKNKFVTEFYFPFEKPIEIN